MLVLFLYFIVVQEIPWLQHRSPDSVAEQMVQVLSPKLNSESSEEIGQLFQVRKMICYFTNMVFGVKSECEKY